ncbi:PREDICTED: zinc finger protein 423-like [Cyprinodon variegatus]|uniref:zinc finger protein 423-like n=1 Tax=Cyprinodon variegatus TaxID=28743 RepID=UPI000742584F|nr:PREDICTED: zinc finger protein 423-like [Cyprinodon variegatus]
MSRRKQAKPRSVKAVEEGEPSEGGGTWDESAVQTDVPAPNRELELKEGQGGEDGEQEERDDDDLDDESIFTCDNCQQDFDCLAELTEHRTNHCPAAYFLLYEIWMGAVLGALRGLQSEGGTDGTWEPARKRKEGGRGAGVSADVPCACT